MKEIPSWPGPNLRSEAVLSRKGRLSREMTGLRQGLLATLAWIFLAGTEAFRLATSANVQVKNIHRSPSSPFIRHAACRGHSPPLIPGRSPAAQHTRRFATANRARTIVMSDASPCKIKARLYDPLLSGCVVPEPHQNGCFIFRCLWAAQVIGVGGGGSNAVTRMVEVFSARARSHVSHAIWPHSPACSLCSTGSPESSS